MSVWHLGEGVHQDQRRVSDSIDLEFQAIVNNQIWLLGTNTNLLEE